MISKCLANEPRAKRHECTTNSPKNYRILQASPMIEYSQDKNTDKTSSSQQPTTRDYRGKMRRKHR